MSDCTSYDCSKASAELDAFVRGDLPLDQAERMQEHLERCGHCADVARYEQAFRARLRRMGDGCCPDGLRTRILALLAQHGPDASG
ncbi:MAG TPA: zf-HC2 domain-containing protein [Gemmatimonadales bacterium]|nr:zf-HC2 domain-containing protein [Gemmatimonadales bacterium]